MTMDEIELQMIQAEESESAIRIFDAYKHFSPDTRVLNGLNMNVPLGSIYGLLGSSGCGKTTLIKVILGKLTLDSGYVKINTSSFSDIGYMPQDLCLDTMLTIHETFQYYGSLYKMRKIDIFSKSEELINWLELPSRHTLLKELSGGQCRRVSLAVALLHDPKIIILDEPTVGIDPVLRYEIWQNFFKIVREQAKTIIITTHYVEEAHEANTIGLMRNGVLIEEMSPQDLLIKQNTNSLEEAFLSISQRQQFFKAIQKPIISQNRKFSSTKLYSENGISLIRIRAFVKKNLAVCSRDFLFIFFMIVFPILASIIFNVAIGGNIKNVNIAVQNNEIADCQNVKHNVCFYDDNNTLTLSCEVLEGLQNLEYNLINVGNQETGDLSVEKANSIAFIQFSQNFSKGIQQYILGSWFSTGQYSNESIIYANIDFGNYLIKNQVVKNMYSVIENVIVNSTRSCNEKFFKNPFKISYLVGGKVEQFIHSIATMFLSMLGFYFSSVISTGFMLTEKMDGFLDRSMISGIKIFEVVISITYIETMINCIQMISVMFITYFVFKNPIEITSGLIALIFIICLTGWLGLLFGLLIVGISASSTEATNMVITWNMFQIYVSGIMWPIEAQMPFMKLITEHLPLCYISRLTNNIVLRGWALDHPSVVYGIAIIIGYIFLHVIMLLCLNHLKRDAWSIKHQ